MKKERGRWISGYEGIYVVSNLGRVRSVDRTIISKDGVARRLKGKVLKLVRATYGYHMVGLHKDGEVKLMLVHRIVAKAWLPNPRNLPVVMHLDDVTDNNRVSNLKWGTHKENTQDMIAKNRCNPLRGSEVENSKLIEKDIPKIRKLLAKGCEQKEIANKYGVDPSLISHIKRGKKWSYIT